MKTQQIINLLAVLLLCGSCGTPRKTALTTPVGPSPSAVEHSRETGGLIVYTALDLDGGHPDSDSRPHSNYKIFTQDQKLLHKVSNRVGTHFVEPVVISLAPGAYCVEARAAGFGYVQVPVIIQAGKRTAVHLDGSELSTVNKVSPTEVVSLPDGLVVGWKAQATIPVR
jgi:hypothetical protein